jgi:hypothetical protein
MTSTIKQEERKARAKHVCDECGGDILPRQKYEYYAGKNDGDFFVHKTCESCLSIRSEFFCGSWFWGTIIEELEAHIDAVDGEVPDSCLERLVPAAREKVIAIIDDLIDSSDDDEG